MKNKIIWIITALSFLVSAVSVNFLPEQIEMHRDFNGTVDRYGSRNEIFIYSVLILIITVVFTLISARLNKSALNSSEEKESEMKKNNNKVLVVTGICAVSLQFVMQCVLVFNELASSGRLAFSVEIDSLSVLSLLMGIMFIVIGNIMPKVKRNDMIGLRTNSSMKNDQIWQKSNRFAGRSMVVCGFVTIFSAFLFGGMASVIITVIALLAVAVISSVYAASSASADEK